MKINHIKEGRRRRRKGIFLNKWFLLFSLVLVCVSVAAFFLLPVFRKKAFISPLPQNKYFILVQNNSTTKNLENLLAKNKLSFSSISDFEGNSLLVKLNSGEEVIFSSKKPLDMQISSLQLVLSRLTIEGKRFTRLDFRFNNPVVALKE